MTQEKQVTILKGTAFQYAGCNYRLNSIYAIADLVKAKGSTQNTVIFYDDQKVSVVLDDSVMDRPQDIATYRFEPSFELKEWEKILGNTLYQKDIVDFLRQRNTEKVSELEFLLVNIQNMKLITQMVGDYSYDDNNNFHFMFKTKDGEGSARLPSVINVTMPLLNESDNKYTIEVELELVKPKSENERPTIKFTCNKFDRYWRQAVLDEIEKLKELLPDHLILAGSLK